MSYQRLLTGQAPLLFGAAALYFYFYFYFTLSERGGAGEPATARAR